MLLTKYIPPQLCFPDSITYSPRAVPNERKPTNQPVSKIIIDRLIPNPSLENTRNKSPRNLAAIQLPILTILLQTPAFISQYAVEENGCYEEEIIPWHEIVESTDGAHGERLH